MLYIHLFNHLFNARKKEVKIFLCGDFINDYEGISGYEEFRGDLSLMYFVKVNLSTCELLSLELIPLQIRHFRLNRASPKDTEWLLNVLNREGKRLNSHFQKTNNAFCWP